MIYQSTVDATEICDNLQTFGFINGVDNVKATVCTEIVKADVSSVSPSSERIGFAWIRSDEGLTLAARVSRTHVTRVLKLPNRRTSERHATPEERETEDRDRTIDKILTDSLISAALVCRNFNVALKDSMFLLSCLVSSRVLQSFDMHTNLLTERRLDTFFLSPFDRMTT